ncbi:hypothetical protein D9M73_250560 [compost metagenome]
MLIHHHGLQLTQLNFLSMMFRLQKFALVGQLRELLFKVIDGVCQQAFLIGILLGKKERNRTGALDAGGLLFQKT